MTLLIAYSLFLMLSNMGFSVESYELAVAPSGEGSTITAQRPTKEITAIVSFDFDITVKRDGLQSAESDSEAMNEGQAKAPAWSFTCTDNNSCKTVICTGGPIFTIYNELEYFLTWCGNIYYDVIIENCTFYRNTIDRHTFSGNFKMSTLTIRNCELDTIVDNAFNYQSVNKLTNITFDGVQLKVLNAQIFNGLVAVKNFKLYNVLTQTTSPLKANNFLQPMAASLSNLVLQQTEESDSSKTIYDPTEWLGGDSDTVYSKLLYVDLSGTKFNDTLNGNTFGKLSAVQALRLANCSLSTITENVFTGILSTLKSLDLRYNRLQTLDAGFLATALGKGLNIEFGLNLWSCDCDNVEVIEYMKQVENNSAAETVCAMPMELQGIQIRNLQMRCYDTTTVITTIITPAATSETTTIMTDTTDETTIEKTETAPDAPPISSTTTTNNTSLTTSASTTTRTTETSSKSSPTSSTTMDSSTTSLSSATNTMPTTAYDTTEETTGSNIKTSPTPFTTVINNSTTDRITESSTKDIPFTTAINNQTTALDKTERTTISSTKTSTTLSTTPINNPSLPPLSPLTTTEVDTSEETTESSPKTSATPSTTPINNSTTDETKESSSKNSPTPSTTAINHPTAAVDKTEKTTTSSPKTSPATSPTSPITPVNNSTSTTSSPPITTMPTTADDTNEETTESGNIPITSTTTTIYSTTLSTSSSAASIHRWRW